MIEIVQGITVDPQVRFGRPVIRGTRVPVATVISKMAAGLSFEEVIKEYEITHQDILNVLKYAALRLADEQIWLTEETLAS
jgi:uncharacterized protein (DUF433 family)